MPSNASSIAEIKYRIIAPQCWPVAISRIENRANTTRSSPRCESDVDTNDVGNVQEYRLHRHGGFLFFGQVLCSEVDIVHNDQLK